MRHTVTVLQDDIDNGKRGSAYSCAIARAAQRDLAADRICVIGRHLYVEGDAQKKAVLPEKAFTFEKLFDDGLPVEPFKFEIEL